MSCWYVEPGVDVLYENRPNRIEILVVVVTIVVTDRGKTVGFDCESLIDCLTLHTTDAITRSSFLW